MAPASTRERHVSSLDRLVNVVIDPAAAFAGLDARPAWGVAFVAIVALRFGSLLAFYQPDTTAARLVAGVLFQVVTLIPLIAIMTTALWAAAAVWRVRLTWPGAWSLTTHVTFAYTLLTIAVASVAGALLPESTDVDLRNPPFTNLGSLIVDGQAPVLHALAVEADVRSAYAAVLVWIGVRAVSAARGGDAAWVVATCFGGTVLIACGSALLR
jgi:hypothetical protein